MENQEIAQVFREIATILELKGDNPFRIRAYQKAAQNIESLTENLSDLVKRNSLENISGIGKDLAAKIKEIIETGRLRKYEKLKKSLPSGLIEMLNIPGLGPKTVKLIYESLKIKTIKSLEKAAQKGKLRNLPGIQQKTEENIIKGIAILKEGRARIALYDALEIGDIFIEALKKLKEIKIIEPAGSLRRKKETVKDIDILAISSDPKKVMDTFTTVPKVKEIIACGHTKSSILSNENIQVDLRVVEKESFGAALLYFTGSKNFNISLRQHAIRNGYKINEYGVFKTGKKNERRVAGKTEEEIFNLFGMDPIPPVLREDRGEISKALKHNLPKLIEIGDIKGDFHVHSSYSDGENTVEQLAMASREKGYHYLGVCDHSQSLKIAGGLDKATLTKKISEIKNLNKKFKKIRLLCGAEVDILSDGSLDYPDSILKELDLVIAAIHTGFKQSRKQLTSRIISAIKNKLVHVIAHPTGRLFGVREAYDIDFDQILSACGDYDVALELNAFAQRIDLNDINCMKAKEKKVKIAIGTDSHSLKGLSLMKLGVWTSQRGWLEKNDILNTMQTTQLLSWLSKKR
ncbi:MAG: DNA polymerase/3'-5' exonuclease PolX [Candidatus Omnitrophica bacterium]|nr:DNA polymerase/3'-5' exonuclease PolX [Candidatus Omnitrophota bacterium]